MDPITIGVAFAGAQAAVKGIKEVIALGQDIDSISGKILEFFNHRSVIEQANRAKQTEERQNLIDKVIPKTKKTKSELTVEAFDIAYKARILMRQEYEIYQHLVWSGNGDLWHAMVDERAKLMKQQEAEEAEALRLQMIQEARQKELAELRKDIILAAVIIAIFCLGFWGIVEWMISKGMVLR